MVEIPGEFVAPVEEIMKSLDTDGRRLFKEELHRAVESDSPGKEIAYTVEEWNVSMYLMLDPEIGDKIRRLPELDDESEELTMDELVKRIGL